MHFIYQCFFVDGEVLSYDLAKYKVEIFLMYSYFKVSVKISHVHEKQCFLIIKCLNNEIHITSYHVKDLLHYDFYNFFGLLRIYYQTHPRDILKINFIIIIYEFLPSIVSSVLIRLLSMRVLTSL